MDYEEKVREIGKRHGTNAAEFDLQYIIGGRVSAECANRNALAVIKEYDTEGTLVNVSGADLSGQWADSYSALDLILELFKDESYSHPEMHDSIIEAYEVAYLDAMVETIVNACREHKEQN